MRAPTRCGCRRGWLTCIADSIWHQAAFIPGIGPWLGGQGVLHPLHQKICDRHEALIWGEYEQTTTNYLDGSSVTTFTTPRSPIQRYS